ncbi:DUF58 domain-containing protein [Nocardioides sp. DS6]|uniref:DUF58 domain-containing protein n=1 Tax=Nocardioides eburneus TaxID=3231482 RepID=A0ABV3SUG9_9ACTN
MTTYLPRIKARVALHAHRKVVGLLEGEYASVQLGRSMDFHDLREYVRGDDVKDIDWKATARTRQLLVKRFTATRQHLVVVAVSTGRSMSAQLTTAASKRDLAVFVAGVVGWLAVRHGDKVAVVHGDGQQQHLRPSADTEVALEQGLAAIHDAITPTAPASDLLALLRYVARTVRRRAILVVVSDEHTVSEGLDAALRRLAVQHEVLFVTLDDLDPTTDAGRSSTVEVASGARLPDWLHDRRLAEEYAALAAAEDARMREVLDGLAIAYERVRDERSALGAVFRLLERHRHARH